MAEETKKKPAAKKAPKKKVEEAAPAEVKEEKVSKKAKKAEKVVEAPAKPVVTEAKASATNVRVTPRKVRLVIDLVRGKDVDEALAILSRLNKAAASPVYKLIKSAAANATNNFGMDEDRLYVASIQCSDGMRIKRYIPRAKGSASGIVKRLANVYVVVKMRAE